MSRNTDIDCLLIHKFVYCFESLKIALANMVPILMMSTKLSTLDLSEIRIFRNKGYQS